MVISDGRYRIERKCGWKLNLKGIGEQYDFLFKLQGHEGHNLGSQ